MSNYIEGLPTPMLIPASMYKMKVVVDKIVVAVPIKGIFSELFPDYATTIDKFECVVDKGDGSLVVDFNVVVNLMFATSKYPNLDNDNFFPIGNVEINMEENLLTITGAILNFEEVL